MRHILAEQLQNLEMLEAEHVESADRQAPLVESAEPHREVGGTDRG
jgi:hypothetical protein